MILRVLAAALCTLIGLTPPMKGDLIRDLKRKGEETFDKGKEELKKRGKKIEEQLSKEKISEIRNEMKAALSIGEQAIKDAKMSLFAELERAEAPQTLDEKTRILNSAAAKAASKIYEELQRIPVPEEVKALPSFGSALLDWAQIEAYLLTLRELGPTAQKRAQEGQARYIRFLEGWLSEHKLPVTRATEGDLKAAGVPVLPVSVNANALDEQAITAARLASPKYPWHSPPNGAGTHQFEVPNRLLASRADIRAACIQHDKDFQSPGVSVQEANDRLGQILRRIYFDVYPAMRPILE